MAQVSRQIGWSNESNLLYQILNQLNKLTSVLFGLKEAATPKYKVFTALLTQSGDDDPQSISSGALVKGITYHVIGTGGGNEDFSNVGLPVFYDGAYFVATQNAEPINWDGAALEYNTGAPVVTVLENTIGNIWFTYTGIGNYTVESNGLFIIDKSLSIIGTPLEGVQNNNFAGINFNGDSLFQINVVEPAGVNINDLLDRTPIEIRVYN